MDNEQTINYAIKLDIFEGPLDLLLYLIKKNEIDIYNIPVALVTEQYLQVPQNDQSTQSRFGRRVFGHGVNPYSHQIQNAFARSR